MTKMIQTVDTTEIETQLTSIVITAHVGKRAVSSELQHTPMVSTVVDGETDTRYQVTHRARRFERAAQCPIATARRLYELACERHPSVPCTLRFA